MEQEGWSVTDLSARSGVPEDSLYKYLKGRTVSPRGSILEKLSSPFGKTALELQYGVEENAMQAARKIPLLGQNEIGTIRNRSSLFANWRGRVVHVHGDGLGNDVFAVEVPHAANAPTIGAGDVVIIDPAASIQPGVFVMAFVDELGQGVCRRYRPHHATDASSFTLVAINEDFPQITVSDDNPGHIIGRAVQVIKAL